MTLDIGQFWRLTKTGNTYQISRFFVLSVDQETGLDGALCVLYQRILQDGTVGIYGTPISRFLAKFEFLGDIYD